MTVFPVVLIYIDDDGNNNNNNNNTWYLCTSLCVPSSYLVAAWLFNQHPSGHQHLRSVYQKGAPSFLETEKSPKVPDPVCTEDARRCPNGIAHVARLVSAVQQNNSTRELATSIVLDSLTKTLKDSTVRITNDCCVAGHVIDE